MDSRRITKKAFELLQDFRERHGIVTDRAAISTIIEKYEMQRKLLSEYQCENFLLKNAAKMGKKGV